MKIGNKIPPHNNDAEIAVLGAILFDNKAIDRIYNIISPDSFYNESHHILYEQMLEMSKNNIPIDFVSLTEQLIKNKQLEIVGGTAYLMEIKRKTPSAANVEHYAMIVQERFIKRTIIKTGSKLVNNAYDESSDALEGLRNAESILSDISNDLENKNATTSLKAASIDIITSLNAGKFAGKQSMTGYDEIDKTCGGYIGGRLYILAGWVSSGKTAFMLSQANKLRKQNKRVLIYSIEMTAIELSNRILVQDTKIENWKFFSKEKMNSAELGKLVTITSEYDDFLLINDAPQTINSLNSDINCQINKFDIDLICIDYLQLISPNRRSPSREQEITEIAYAFKNISKKTKIPILALAQLNRKLADRKDKRPVLSDLRDSGAIEQAADIVWFIHRPSIFLSEEEKRARKSELIETDATLSQAKNRHGSIISTEIYFEKRIARFMPPYQNNTKLNFNEPVKSYYEPKDDDDDVIF